MASSTSPTERLASPVRETVVVAGETVIIDGTRYKVIKEGLASILAAPKTAGDAPNKSHGLADSEPQQVFYNPIQQFNRDLSVLAIKAFGNDVLAKKMESSARRMQKQAHKKRKRQDQAEPGDRPSKAEKLGGDGPGPSDAASTTNLNGTNPLPDVPTFAATSVPGATAGHPEDASNTRPPHGEVDAEATKEAEITTEPAPSIPEPSASVNINKIKILDALSASGLRALRYAHELPFPVSVTANDLSASAVVSIQRNVAHNKLGHKITVTKSNAIAHMYHLIANTMPGSSSGSTAEGTDKYDVIDLDPYGTAANFFDAAVQAVRDGGLLCVTCTDAGVWASHGYAEKCHALYGGVPLRGNASHEGGLRIILHAVATSASRYGLAIEPLLSLSIDFYARLFIKIKKSPHSVKFQASKTMMVYNCDVGCGAWTTQPLMKNKAAPNKKGSGIFYKHTLAAAPTAGATCEHCGTLMHIAGPMYAGRIHSVDFIQKILDDLPEASTDVYGTIRRIRGMLHTALEEVEEPPSQSGEGAASSAGGQGSRETNQASGDDSKKDPVAALDPYPFFFLPTQLSKAVHCQTPNDAPLRGALRGLGYRVLRSHCKPSSIKTDAPWSVIWEVMREWVRQKAPVKVENINPRSPGYRLLKLGEVDENSAEAPADPTQQTAASKLNVVFDAKLGQDHDPEKLVRYQMNPRENWGPMVRAKAH